MSTHVRSNDSVPPASGTGEAQRFAGALELHRAGDLNDAFTAYSSILAQNPDHVDSLHLSGVIAIQQGHLQKGVDSIARAIELCKAPAAAMHNNLAGALRGLGKLDEALLHYEKATQLEPAYVEAYTNSGMVLLQQGQMEAAALACSKAVELRPRYANGHYALGIIRQAQGALEEARRCYGHAIELNPSHAGAHNNLGLIAAGRSDLDAAIGHYQRALSADPNCVDVHYNLAITLTAARRFEDAIAHYRLTRTLSPNHIDATWNEALLHLLLADFSLGFSLYQSRWRRPGFVGHFRTPAWNGESLVGREIVLYTEQGFGDTLQFVRYAALVKARGARRVILECSTTLQRLMRSASGVDQVVSPQEPPLNADYYAPLLDLPRLFHTEVTDIPAKVPYLSSGEAQTPGEQIESSLRIGIAWRGNSANTTNSRKSLVASLLTPLMTSRRDAQWVCLQIDATAEEMHELHSSAAKWVVPPAPYDWAATAKIIEGLDLVVSVDTAVAHLAGALGKPLWVLLTDVPDWRWLLDREDSPWYPSARLFRQTRAGDWRGVIGEVRRRLIRFGNAD